LGCFGVLMFLKGDWAEYASTVGFPSWADGLRPCPMCNAHRQNFFTMYGLRAEHLPWRLNADDDYEHACARSERRVVLRTVEEQGRVLRAFQYDIRGGGGGKRQVFARGDSRAWPSDWRQVD